MVVAALSHLVDGQYVDDTPERFAWGFGWLKKQGESGDCYHMCSVSDSEGNSIEVRRVFRYFIDRSVGTEHYFAYGPWEMCAYFFKLLLVTPLVFFGMSVIYLVQIAFVFARFACQGLRCGWQVSRLKEDLPDVCSLGKFVIGVEIAALYGLVYYLDSRVSARMQVVISQLDREWNGGASREERLPHLVRRCTEICREQFKQSRSIDVQSVWEELHLREMRLCFSLCEDFQPISGECHLLAGEQQSYDAMDEMLRKQVVEASREGGAGGKMAAAADQQDPPKEQPAVDG